jgi:hypothetical protein
VSFKVPLDAPDLPGYAEPGGAALVLLAGLYETGVKAVHTHGGMLANATILFEPYVYVPHEVIIPGAHRLGELPALTDNRAQPQKHSGRVYGPNSQGPTIRPTEMADWIARQLAAK